MSRERGFEEGLVLFVFEELIYFLRHAVEAVLAVVAGGDALVSWSFVGLSPGCGLLLLRMRMSMRARACVRLRA